MLVFGPRMGRDFPVLVQFEIANCIVTNLLILDE